ncbi:MAG: tetratricopeptide repeat protein, partial [Pirellulales bacterium]|nr:tetratricopeptide repeat protein [Pirellulales bacterium]
MRRIVLLSEINPASVNLFNPLTQARDWYQLVSDAEVEQRTSAESFDFPAAIKLIADRCAESERGELVLRDWSHIDYIGFPFVKQPILDFGLRSQLKGIAKNLYSVATVRHPIEQYLSMRRLSALNDNWDEERLWRGIRLFSEAIQSMPWVRFEDFLLDPSGVLEKICDWMKVPFDSGYVNRWHDYHNISGDNFKRSLTIIEPQRRKFVPEDTWKRLAGNQDFFSVMELLGYPLPARLRRPIVAMTERVSPAGENDAWLAAEQLIEQADEAFSSHQWEVAIVHYQAALQVQSQNRHVSARLTECLVQTGEYAQALLETQRILDGDPLDEQALRQRVLCLETLGQSFEAIPYRRRLVEICPGDRENQFMLANQLTGVGCIDESITLYRRLLEQHHDGDGAAANYLLNLNYSDRRSAAEIANEHFRVGMRFADRPRKHIPRNSAADGRLRIGYLSSDFYVHPVGKIMRSILPHLDQTQFHVTAYYDKTSQDGLTAQIREQVETFHNIGDWADDRLAQQIDADQIDVLFDLGGYTAGGNRLRVLAQRAAPLQISFLGYPNTSALNTLDYRLTDRLADPPGLVDHLYGEKSLYLENGFLTWTPYEVVDDIVAAPAKGARLGSFNNVAKISPSTLRCWAEILRRAPDSTLVLKYGDRFSSETVCDRFRRLFAEHGVLPDRLEFRRAADTLKGHMELMAGVDLALDSFPYQGTMTSLECLSVGTPILSLCGDYYAHRTTSAMMMRL